ncbi:hypothetical protein XI04_03865 [Bradyrhizobium sp. CCBAU 11430]|nr:hypothetical protein [Bradyrhizobium sp. CCBAU 25360]MDA9512207.1 hypothetical protein [Bradyrhizobium sp. CCBAU 11430]
MSDTLYLQAIELLLSAMYRTRGDDGLENRFLVGPPGTPLWQKRISTFVFFRRRLLVRAALYVRKVGPPYLRSTAMNDIQSQLRSFAIAHYGLFASETFLRRFEESYNERIGQDVKIRLADLLAASELFNPKSCLALYPLVPVVVETDFRSSPFFLLQPGSVSEIDTDIKVPAFSPEVFPPVANWDARTEKASSWLGIRSPIIQASNKIKAAVLGALALTPHPRCRHQFSMRSMFGGLCSFDAMGRINLTFGEAHTPAMAEDIVIRQADHDWLAMLALKLGQTDDPTRRQIRALEYYYRAWPLDPHERFPWLFMTLDAIFGDSGRATQAIIDAVKPDGGAGFEYKRLRLLLRLRASVIHGGAPDVYDSDKYHEYYEQYGDDPLDDLEVITAKCLRAHIFEGVLVEHPDPHADLIRAYQDGTLGRHSS